MRQRLLDAGLPTDAERPRALPHRSRRPRDRDGAEVLHALQPRRRAAREHRRLERALHPGLERPQDHGSPHRRDAPREFDGLRRVRAPVRRPAAHPVPRDGLFDEQGHRAAGLGRLAPVHGADDHEETGRLRRLRRARRAAHGGNDAAFPPRPRGAHRQADVDLHDHRDRQLPLRRGLLPEPPRLRRGRHPGRDRAGDAHGTDRAGHAGRRAGASTASTC